MASYHLHGKIISRSSGRSAVAAAAYRSRSSITDERQGLEFDYSKKQDLVYSAILLPEGAPARLSDRKTLWNEVEESEKRKDSQVAREVEVALPLEHSRQQNIQLVREFVNDQFVSKGMIADVNIHNKSDNPHAHILLTTRNVNENGFADKNRSWNSKDDLLKWRKEWAKVQNEHLSMNGFSAQVDHRSFAEMGIDLVPQEKIGVGHYSQDSELDRVNKHIEILRTNGQRISDNPQIALEELTNNNSTFTTYDLYKFANSHSYGEEQFRKVVSSVLLHDNVVPLQHEQYTTKDIIELEKTFSDNVEKLIQNNDHALQEHYKSQTLHGYGLDESQERAYNQAVNDSGLSVIVGVAGSGKSYMLGAVRDSYESAGFKISGMALSAIATNNLEESSGIHSKTIYSTLKEWEKGENLPGANDVVVLDEAAMVDTKNMERISHFTQKGNSKLIAIGDVQQLQSIGHGGGLAYMQDKAGFALMDNVRRQKIEWQADATKLLSGNENSVKEALELYSNNGKIQSSENSHDAKLNLLNDFTSDYGKDKRIILTHKLDDVAELNSGSRKILQRKGVLGSKEITFSSNRGTISLAEKDRIVFLEGNKRMGVKNGTLGTVRGIRTDSSMVVDLDSGGSLSFSGQDYNKIAYGYATTIHKSQGSTVDNAFIFASKGFDKHLSYVAMSRHENDAKIYYSIGSGGFKSENHFKDILSRDNTKILAQESLPTITDSVDHGRIEKDRIDIMLLKTGDVKKAFDTNAAESNGQLIIEHPSIALDLLSHHRAVFSGTDIQKFAHANSESSQFQNVVSAIKNSDEIIQLTEDRYTTQTLLEHENNVFKSIENLKDYSHSKITQDNIDHALEFRSLNADQEEVFNYLVDRDSSVKVVRGLAGTGKSYVMGSVREAFEISGIQVRGVAPSGIAASGLEDGSSINSNTVHKQLTDWDNGRNPLEKGSVLVVDEAGTVGTEQFDKLVKHVEDTQSTIILLGDSEQLQSVAAGTVFGAIGDEVDSIVLDDVIRQKEPWQKGATMLLGEKGKIYTEEALNLYDERGKIFASPTKEEAVEKIISSWSEDYKSGPSDVVILASTVEDTKQLNSVARIKLQENDLLDKNEFKILNGDDEVVSFANRDQIIFTKNNESLGVKNGTRGTVIGFDKGVLEVQLDPDNVISFDTQKYSDVAHGYAMTIHKSQGISVDTSYVLATENMDKHQTYVSLSRHKEDVQLHFSEEEFADKHALNNNSVFGDEKPTREPIEILKDKLSRSRNGIVIRDYIENGEYKAADKENAIITDQPGAASANGEARSQDIQFDSIPNDSSVGVGQFTSESESQRIKSRTEMLKEKGEAIIEDPQLALNELTRSNSTFTAYDIFTYTQSNTFGEQQFRDVVGKILDNDQTVALDHDRYSTQDILKIENNLIGNVKALTLDTQHSLGEADKTNAFQNWNLDDGQKAAFNEAVNDKGLSIVSGVSASGKSYTVGAVKDAYESGGFNVRGMAVSGVIAETLQMSSGINSNTVYSSLKEWDKGENLPGKKDVVVLDDATSIDSYNLEQITKHVRDGGAKLVAIGDKQQIQAIGAGGGFAMMEEQAGSVALDTSKRQNVKWQKQATRLFSGDEKDVSRAIDIYSSNGNIIAAADTKSAKISVIQDYTDGYGNDSRVILTQKNSDVSELNKGVREVLKRDGKIGQEDITLKTDNGDLSLAQNDRIVFLQGNNRLGVNNGTTGTFHNLTHDNKIVVSLDSGKKVAFDADQYNKIDHGYAMTIHKSQSVTVDKSFVYATKGFDKHLTNAAMTRHQEDAKLYYSEGPNGFETIGVFKETVSRDNAKKMAQDFIPDTGLPQDSMRKHSDKVDIMLLKTGSVAKAFDPAQAESNGNVLINHPNIGLNLLSHHETVFSDRDIQVFAHNNSNKSQYERVVCSILGSDQIVQLSKNKYTTLDLVKAENRLLSNAEELHTQKHENLSAESIENAVKSRTLDVAQRAAFDHLVKRDSSIKVVAGVAGAGKSYLLGAVRDAFESEGIEIKGVALSGVAAKGLEQSSSITTSTIHQKLIEWDNGKNMLAKGSVLVVDEAGTVGTKQLDALSQYVKDAGGTLLLVGDGQQLQSVAAGTPYDSLKYSVGFVHAKDVRRQEVEWQKQGTLLFSEEGAKSSIKALDLYNEHGNIIATKDIKMASEQMVSSWIADYNKNPAAVAMLTSTKKDALILNNLAREQLKTAGSLTNKEFTILNSGDENVNFSINDRVIFTRNNKTLGVENGSVGSVTGFEGRVMGVKLDSGKVVNFDTEQYNDVSHGYAMTIHKSQGITVDKSYVLASRQMDTHSAYVAMSRHRSNVKLFYSEGDFTDQKGENKNKSPYEILQDTLSRSRKGSLVRDHVSKDKYKEIVSKEVDTPEHTIKEQTKESQVQYNYRLSLFNKATDKKLESKDVGLTLHPEKQAKETKELLKGEIKSMAIKSKLDLKSTKARISRLKPTRVDMEKSLEQANVIARDRDYSL